MARSGHHFDLQSCARRQLNLDTKREMKDRRKLLATAQIVY